MDRFKEVVPSHVRDYVAATVITIGGCSVVIKVGAAVFSWISKKRVERRWRSTPKDVVIVHRVPPVYAAPNASPFVLKLETYLRMTNIPYQIDLGDGMGPKGKTPWITLNGEHISDSQLCIEFLQKKFEKQLGNYTAEQKAVSTMARIMMDEHFYWGLITWRYIFSSAKGYGPEKVFAMPALVVKLFMAVSGLRHVRFYAWCQGIGRHSEEQILKFVVMI